MALWTRQVEAATRRLLPRGGELKWLLRQSMHTHMQRLAVLPAFGLRRGAVRVLDVGAGTGAMCLDVAWACGPEARVVAVDNDARGLALLREMSSALGCAVEGRQGEAYRLPVETASQDLTLSRFVFQHLERPESALAEMVRVTAPGGRVAVLDVDDGAWLSHPAAAPEVVELNAAVRRLQGQVGAGRQVGRELYRMFRAAGLAEIQVLAVPRVQLGTYHGRDAELEAHQKEFYLGFRDRLIAAGLMTAAGFEAAMTVLEAGFANDDFGFACEFLAIGRVAAA